MAKVVLVDFDGVLHSYTSGWQGEATISDPPVSGAIEWLTEMVRQYTTRSGEDFDNIRIAIYSSRSKHKGGVEAMQEWLLANGLPAELLRHILFPREKSAAFLTLDDRAICFDGVFPTREQINAFKPWYKR